MPFLNTLYVWKEYIEQMDAVVLKLRQYDIGEDIQGAFHVIGYLFEAQIEIEDDSSGEYEERLPVAPVIKVREKKAKKKPERKNRTQLAYFTKEIIVIIPFRKNFDELVKQTTQHKKPVVRESLSFVQNFPESSFTVPRSLSKVSSYCNRQ